MGIVVCICMLLGLVALRPTPWRAGTNHKLDSRVRVGIATLLLILGLWNTVYGFFKIDGFWFWASIISGITMMAAAILVFSEQQLPGRVRSVITAILATFFLLYFVTIVQLNLGYPVLR